MPLLNTTCNTTQSYSEKITYSLNDKHIIGTLRGQCKAISLSNQWKNYMFGRYTKAVSEIIIWIFFFWRTVPQNIATFSLMISNWYPASCIQRHWSQYDIWRIAEFCLNECWNIVSHFHDRCNLLFREKYSSIHLVNIQFDKLIRHFILNVLFVISKDLNACLFLTSSMENRDAGMAYIWHLRWKRNSQCLQMWSQGCCPRL